MVGVTAEGVKLVLASCSYDQMLNGFAVSRN